MYSICSEDALLRLAHDSTPHVPICMLLRERNSYAGHAVHEDVSIRFACSLRLCCHVFIPVMLRMVSYVCMLSVFSPSIHSALYSDGYWASYVPTPTEIDEAGGDYWAAHRLTMHAALHELDESFQEDAPCSQPRVESREREMSGAHRGG